MSRSLKFFLFISVLFMGFVSCEKTAVTACFPDSSEATYTGTGTISNVPYSGTLKLTKLSCTSAKIEAGSLTETISSLDESSTGTFNGKTSDGAAASITLDGKNISVAITGRLTFSGDK